MHVFVPVGIKPSLTSVFLQGLVSVSFAQMVLSLRIMWSVFVTQRQHAQRTDATATEAEQQPRLVQALHKMCGPSWPCVIACIIVDIKGLKAVNPLHRMHSCHPILPMLLHDQASTVLL